MDRERWFNVVMGEDYKVDMRTTEKLANRIAFPASAAAELAFKLGVVREVDSEPDPTVHDYKSTTHNS